MLLHGTHPLPDGVHVRLRLPLAGDRAAAHELLWSLGLEADELELRRALRCIPGRRAAVVAVGWDGVHQRAAGFGSLDVRSGALTLVGLPGVAAVLEEALREQAQTWRRRVA